MLTAADISGQDMVGPGPVLRRLREAAGYTYTALAQRAHMDHTLICKLESGRRPMRTHHARQLDDALSTGTLLQSLVQAGQAQDGEAPMDRRAMLWMLSAAASVTAATGRATLDELLRYGLLDTVEKPEDWDPVLADLQRRLVLDPDETLGTTLTAKLLIVRQAITDKRHNDNVRAAATLSLLYGLWQGNAGHTPAALDWYRTAATLAKESQDPATQTYVLGRSASRGVYEGMSRDEVTRTAQQALAVTSQPTLGALEAHSALVGVAAMTGNLTAGREGVTAMRQLAERLPDEGPTGAYPRTANFHTFVEARGGDLKSATRAQQEAEQALAKTPLWLAESRVYHALAMARAGDIRGGATFALDAINTVPWSVHTLTMAAADVLTAVPEHDRSDEVMQLRHHASRATRPWETL